MGRSHVGPDRLTVVTTAISRSREKETRKGTENAKHKSCVLERDIRIYGMIGNEKKDHRAAHVYVLLSNKNEIRKILAWSKCFSEPKMSSGRQDTIY
jgi:hypothetical protein